MNELSRFVKGWGEKPFVSAYLEDERWSLTARLVRAGLVLLSLVSLVIMAGVLTGGVALSPRNLSRLGPQSMTAVMAAAAMVFLFAQGSIDFSFMPAASLSAAVFAKLLTGGLPLPAAAALAVCAAAAVGALNGLLVGLTKLPGLLLTLVTALLAQSLARVVLQDQVVPLGLAGGAQNPIRVLLIVNWTVALAVFALAGLASYAPGALKKAFPSAGEGAEPSGLRFALPYAASGIVAGLTGVFFAFRLEAATPAFGSSWQHEILFVLFFSGTIFGDRAGNPLAVLLAVVYLSLLNNLNSILGMNLSVQILMVVGSAFLSALYNLGYEALVGFLYRRSITKLASPA